MYYLNEKNVLNSEWVWKTVVLIASPSTTKISDNRIQSPKESNQGLYCIYTYVLYINFSKNTFSQSNSSAQVLNDPFQQRSAGGFTN